MPPVSPVPAPPQCSVGSSCGAAGGRAQGVPRLPAHVLGRAVLWAGLSRSPSEDSHRYEGLWQGGEAWLSQLAASVPGQPCPWTCAGQEGSHHPVLSPLPWPAPPLPLVYLRRCLGLYGVPLPPRGVSLVLPGDGFSSAQRGRRAPSCPGREWQVCVLPFPMLRPVPAWHCPFGEPFCTTQKAQQMLH